MWPFSKEEDRGRYPVLGLIKRNGFIHAAVSTGGAGDEDQSPLVIPEGQFGPEALAGLVQGPPSAIGLDGLKPSEVTPLQTKWEAAFLEIPTADWLLRAFGIPGVGVAVFADRFMAAGGRDPEGSTWVAGDWPAPISNSGALQDVLLRCAHTMVSVLDKRMKSSLLRSAFPEAVGASSPEEFMDWVLDVGAADTQKARKVLSVLSSAARSGDAVAGRLISVLAADIAACGLAVIDTLGLRAEKKSFSVLFGGCVFREVRGLTGPIRKRIQRQFSQELQLKFDLIQPLFPPAAVARLAAERL